MLKVLLYLGLMSFVTHQANTLNYIGYNSEDIKDFMQKNDSDFYFKKEFETNKAQIIKYTDMAESKTLLYILDSNNYCKYYMIMYDYMYYNDVVKDLDNNFKAHRKNTWIEELDGDRYKKYIEKKEWYFTLITRKIEN